jgi:hypothetical protein
MKRLLTAMFIASTVTLTGAVGAFAQAQPRNNDPACDATGMGSDPRCVGVVPRGDVRDLPGFRAYVTQQRHPVISIPNVQVGAVLPATGYTYYEVPPQFGAGSLNYAVVDGRTVLIDRESRRVISIID